uniref:Uncharacterized protein n=1 Tax=Ditylenchus dipsaci TaxID=166011 RepID=A0A915EWD6_9BILA
MRCSVLISFLTITFLLKSATSAKIDSLVTESQNSRSPSTVVNRAKRYGYGSYGYGGGWYPGMYYGGYPAFGPPIGGYGPFGVGLFGLTSGLLFGGWG